MHYNPLDKFYKSIIGAVPAGEDFTLRVKGDFKSVELKIKKDGLGIEKKVALNFCGDFFECNISLSKGLYWYYFIADGKFISLGSDYTGVLSDSINYFQLSVYEPNFSTPSWIKGGIIYQIFPDRFNIGKRNKKIENGKILHKNLTDDPLFLPNKEGEVLNNDFFGGDLLGITKKISHLKTLGVTAIYLNPIFKAYSNHRYDTADYLKIDELLGTDKDFDNLIKVANDNGIKIILDGVFNHTGSDSVYFNINNTYDNLGAYQGENSPYYKWFKFKEFPNDYESWWGIKTLPATNKDNEDFIEFITGENGVLSHYIKKGVSGIRLDVVDELPAHFVRRIRNAVKSVDDNAIIIGEVWEDASNKISYGNRREYFLGNELDSVMNYPLKNAIINYVKSGKVEQLLQTIKEQLDHYPKNVLDVLMNMLATHDTFRLISALSDREVAGLSKTQMSKIKLSGREYQKATDKCKIATLLSYTLYGVPSIYYGDEIGMQGYVDPLNRRFFDWDNIDQNLYSWHVKLGEIRSKINVFTDGELEIVYAKNGALVFKRFNNESEALIAINLGKDTITLDFDGELTDLVSEKKYNKKISLKKNTYGIFVNLA